MFKPRRNQQFDLMNALEKSRFRFAQVLVITVFITSLGGSLAQTFVALSSDNPTTSFGIFVTLGLAFGCLGLLSLLQRGFVEMTLGILTLSLAISSVTFATTGVNLFVSVLTIIIASTLTSHWMYGIATIIVIGRAFFDLLVIVQEYGLTVRDEGITQVVLIGTLFTLSVTTRFLVRSSQETAAEAQRASTLLRTTAEISQITSTILDLKELFNRAVEIIRDRFVYYHVQIFLVDDNREYADLVASTGEVGQMLLERQHRLPVGSASVIGRVTQIGEPVIASDTDSKQVIYARNELLPNTRSELAVAIMDGDRIIGALDVQSTRPNAFSTIDIQSLQIVANQLGIAIRNARLFEAQANSLQENKRLLYESELNLREIQRLNNQLTRKIWTDYLLDKRDLSGIMLEGADVIRKDVDWTPRMIEASQKRRPSVIKVNDDGSAVVAVPIILRGEVIGAIEVETSSDVRQDDSIEIVQAVAQRLALSLDNVRLFEETQRNVRQQQAINNLVGQFQSAITVDELLQMTLTEISQLMGAKQGTIRLGSALVRTGHVFDSQNGNGSAT